MYVVRCQFVISPVLSVNFRIFTYAFVQHFPEISLYILLKTCSAICVLNFTDKQLGEFHVYVFEAT